MLRWEEAIDNGKHATRMVAMDCRHNVGPRPKSVLIEIDTTDRVGGQSTGVWRSQHSSFFFLISHKLGGGFEEGVPG